jgi:pimeloyl-ACP methyl ester carboxylesterase
MRLAIHDEPLPPGCPVVYLPGIDGTGRLLYRQTGLFARYAVRCVSYPQDDRHSYRDLVASGIQHLEATGPAVLLVESFGGAVALWIALERPDLVRRLVLINTFAYYPLRTYIEVLRQIGPWLPNVPAHPVTRRLRGLLFFGPGVPQSEQDEWWDRTADVPLRVYGHRIRLLAGIDLRPRLSEIQIPTLVFAAPHDWIVPARAGRLLAKRLPRAKLLTIPTAHAALIHPRVDVANWLETAAFWPTVRSGPGSHNR